MNNENFMKSFKRSSKVPAFLLEFETFFICQINLEPGGGSLLFAIFKKKFLVLKTDYKIVGWQPRRFMEVIIFSFSLLTKFLL